MAIMQTWFADVRVAARGLRRHPGYALAAVLTLVIGIGANTAVFTLGHWLLLRPVPGVHEPDRLVALSLMAPGGGGAGLISHPELAHLRASVTGLAGLAGYMETPLNVAVDGATPRRLEAAVVSDDYFDVLGAPVAIGRPFTRDEGAQPGAPPAAVVSDGFWRSSLGGVPEAIGRPVVVNGVSFTVVGVTRPGFGGTSRAGRTDIWVPSAQHAIVLPMYRGNVLTSDRASIYFGVVGRLAAHATVSQVEQEANAARTARLGGSGNRRVAWTFVAREGMEPTPWMRDRVNRLLVALVGGVVLLLTLTCANVGNLLLARATGRRREIATRLALGASRGSVARLLIAESVTLAAIGGAAALVFAWGLSRLLDGAVLLPGVVTLSTVRVEWPVMAFAVGLALIVAVVAGLMPAWTAARVDVREGARGDVTGGRAQRVLTVAQVAVSVTLLLGAALLVRSMQARMAIPIGFDPTQVLSLSLEPSLQRYTPQRTDAFYRDLMARVRTTPGVRAAGLAWLAPYSQGASDTSFWPEGATADAAVSANHNIVSPGFLDAMGIPLVEGRDFSDQEFLRREVPGQGVVIITASLARTLFDGGSAVGRRITMRFPEGVTRTIVGVIPDQRQHRLMESHADLLLEPFGQSFTPGAAALQVAMAGPAPGIVDGLTAAVRALDPTLPLFQVRTVDAAIRQTMSEERLVAQSVTAFAALAMLVAAIGLAAVLARMVTARQREFGVRVACGATAARVALQVTREAMVLAAGGIVIGLGLSMWFVGLISARLYGVPATDVTSIAIVVGAVLTVALLSALVPARRAASVDPARVLR